MLYSDAAQDRLADEERRAIETARAAIVFAHDNKTYTRWRSRDGRRGVPAGRNLAALARDVGGQRGGHLVVGDFEFRKAG